MATMLALVVLTVSGLLVGWRIDSDLLHAIAGFGLLVLFATAMLWTGTLLGLLARSVDAVQGFVFVEGLPDGLRQVAEWNPVSSVVAAVRSLFGNPTAVPDGAAWPLQHPVLAGTAWSLLVLAAVVPATIARFRARTTD